MGRSTTFTLCCVLSVLVALAMVRGQSLVDVLSSDPQLSNLTAAVIAADLSNLFDGSNGESYTVFAPLDSAFAQVDQGLLTALLTEPSYIAHLQNLLAMHVAEGQLMSDGLSDGMTVTMLNAEDNTVNIEAEDVTIDSPKANSSLVVEADIAASNGVVHKVDSVLLPAFIGTSIIDSALNDPMFTIIAGLFKELSGEFEIPEDIPATVLAPTDDAFTNLGDDVLAYIRNPDNASFLFSALTDHVLLGLFPTQTLTDGQNVTTALGKSSLKVSIRQGDDGNDVYYFNNAVVIKTFLSQSGIVYAIDSFLSPVPDLSTGSPSVPTGPVAPTAAVPTIAPAAIGMPASSPVVSTSASQSHLIGACAIVCAVGMQLLF